MNARIIYGLRAEGESLNGYRKVLYSYCMFTTSDAAEAHRAEFVGLCCDDITKFECLSREGLQVTITERELNE